MDILCGRLFSWNQVWLLVQFSYRIEIFDKFPALSLLCSLTKVLLDWGANVAAVCKDGQTALSFAQKYRYENIIHLLLNAGDQSIC